MKIQRSATATWRGPVEAGTGTITVGSGAFNGAYSFRSRMADDPHTNPEELIGAGHAGCFAMSLANLVAKAGHPANEIAATARVSLEQVDGRFTLTRIALSAVGEVPGLDEQEFVRLAGEAKVTCPVSRALAGVEITLDARLAVPVSPA
jgi:osmotically inducible protein OsmC